MTGTNKASFTEPLHIHRVPTALPTLLPTPQVCSLQAPVREQERCGLSEVWGAVGAGRSPNPEAAEVCGHGEVTTTSTALTVCRLHLDRPRHLWKGGHGQGGRGQSGERVGLSKLCSAPVAHLASTLSNSVQVRLDRQTPSSISKPNDNYLNRTNCLRNGLMSLSPV